jgi:enediyne biosynthesis protein E4
VTGNRAVRPWRAGTALAAGVLVGMAATAALAFFVVDLVEGDAPSEAMGAPAYVEDTHSAGVDHIYDGEFQYFVGGGVAVLDCNADMRPDLFVAGGSEGAGLFVNESELGGELRFKSRLAESTDLTGVTGAYPLDIDSDGHMDIAVLRVGENVMLRGTGGCVFERANELWGVDGGDDWTTAFSARWDPGEQLPTMAFGNYRQGTDPGDGCADHQILSPDAGRYRRSLALSPGWCTLSIMFSDWSRTGKMDLRMTNDRHYYQDGQEQLWRVAEDGTASEYSEEGGWQPLQIWGMGIASRDLTGDGRPEVFLTSQGDNKLQHRVGDDAGPTFEDIALEVGATAHRPFIGDINRPSTAWHAEFGDVNNDGFVDLFVSKGNVDAQVEFAADDPNNLLISREDGTFREGAGDAGLVDYARSRGAAVTDLNLDGLLDVVVVERREPVRIWRNMGPAGKWLAMAPRQQGSNRDAIGALVEVKLGNQVQTVEVTVGGGHAGGESGPIHFGLGEADAAQVRVTWPDGEVGRWVSVDANQIASIERGSDTATSLFPIGD